MANRGRDETRVVIMGAAGRDFHNFNVVFKHDPQCRVVAFTAAQIPNIAGRRYPRELSGPHYPNGIPIVPEEQLEALVAEESVDQVVFAYSDVSHEHVMHQASKALAGGADFRLLGPRATMLRSSKPVISVCAVRTGAGKTPVARWIAAWLAGKALRVAVVRHPMPYGDLAQQQVQRFATLEDLAQAHCTIEEREEYEPHLARGAVVFAGVDYERILRQAEAEADVILWDGGNNDLPFFQPDLELVLVDPHRAGHERTYFPGEVNLLRADAVIITKMDSADPRNVAAVRETIRRTNPRAQVVDSVMRVTVEHPTLIQGKRVLVVEDGPTVTHGGMASGAGMLAAKQYGAVVVDPRPAAVGALQATFRANQHLESVLPAMGYGDDQMRDLEETINRVACDAVILATPADLRRVITIKHPVSRVRYDFEEIGQTLPLILKQALQKQPGSDR